MKHDIHTDRNISRTPSAGFNGISGAILKWIALVTMLIDHFAVAVYKPALHNDFTVHTSYKLYYDIMRDTGRIAFPIFIFLLIEGYKHTKSTGKYLLRLAIFAIISEIPFDLAVYGKVFHPEKQNVFFTLIIGFLVIFTMDHVNKELRSRLDMTSALPFAEIFLYVFLTAAGCAAAYFLKVDYSYVGVLAICIPWMMRKKPKSEMLMCCFALLLSSSREIFAFIALLPILFYNGKRGHQIKYFFYIFYPAHLIILWLIYKFIT